MDNIWIKKGLIYNVDERVKWGTNTIMTPNPILIDDETVRVYCGIRDDQGRSRIGYIDLSASNPSKILRFSERPVLDLGAPGMFDDNGVILGDVLKVGDLFYMYYVGFQIPANAKFLACSGLAVSRDGGESFQRMKQTPIADRVPNAPFGRCIHTVLHHEGKFKIWYSVIYGWEHIDGKPYPQYDIRYVESADGIHIQDDGGIHCLGVGPGEYRIGRPRVVVKRPGRYEMRYTFDTLQKEYISGLAYSEDGVHWIRRDEDSGLLKSPSGWDSEMACYPVELETKYGTYLFYAGNGMGAGGFGYCVLNKK